MIHDKSPESLISPWFFIDIVAFNSELQADPWFCRPGYSPELPGNTCGWTAPFGVASHPPRLHQSLVLSREFPPDFARQSEILQFQAPNSYGQET